MKKIALLISIRHNGPAHNGGISQDYETLQYSELRLAGLGSPAGRVRSVHTSQVLY